MMTTRYAIVSRSSLEGFQAGSFQTLFGLYYKEQYMENGHNYIRWADVLCDAFLFDSEQDAWNLALDIWGFAFARSSMMVVSVTPEAIEKSTGTKKRIEEANAPVTA